MIKDYEYETDSNTYTCKACGYVYADRWTEKGLEIIKGDDEFIELEEVVKKGIYDNTLVKMYACPKCGTVHIEV